MKIVSFLVNLLKQGNGRPVDTEADSLDTRRCRCRRRRAGLFRIRLSLKVTGAASDNLDHFVQRATCASLFVHHASLLPISLPLSERSVHFSFPV